jgi:PAS domain S-box-containing protein
MGRPEPVRIRREPEVRVIPLAALQTGNPWIFPTIVGAASALAALLSGTAAWFGVGRKKRGEHEDVICTRLKRVFETFHNGMMVVDRELVILMANKQARAITGYGIDLVGRSIYDLIPPEFRDRHREHVRRFFNDPHTRRMGGDQKFPMVDRFGQQKTLRISLSPVENEYGGLETTVGMDVIQDA